MHGRYYVCPLGYGMLWLNTHLINYAIPEDQWLRKSLVRAHAHTARKKGGDGNEEKHGGEDIWGGHMWTRQDDEDGDRHDTDGFGLLRKVDSYVGHSLPLAVYSSRIPTGDQTRRTSSDNLCAFLLGSVPKSNEKASLTLGNAIEELHVLPNKPR